jgi:hypothetical protein
MEREGGVIERLAGVNRVITVLILNLQAALQNAIVFNPPAAGAVLVSEIGNRRIQGIKNLVISFGLPVADILGIMGARAGATRENQAHPTGELKPANHPLAASASRGSKVWWTRKLPVTSATRCVGRFRASLYRRFQI